MNLGLVYINNSNRSWNWNITLAGCVSARCSAPPIRLTADAYLGFEFFVIW